MNTNKKLNYCFSYRLIGIFQLATSLTRNSDLICLGFKKLMQIHRVNLNACKCNTNKLVIDKFKTVNKRDPNKTRNLAQEMAQDKMLTDSDYF